MDDVKRISGEPSSRTIIARSVPDGNNGLLSVLEVQKDIPFEIKRIYYITGVSSDTVRGYHAHKKLWQVLFCPYGSIEIRLEDISGQRTVLLDEPQKAIIIGPGVWREMKWHQSSSVLCVAASEFYDESDYIRDYATFKRLIERGPKDDD